MNSNFDDILANFFTQDYTLFDENNAPGANTPPTNKPKPRRKYTTTT